MSWSKEQVELLISEYKKFPCLYAVKTEAYKNKHAKNHALEQVAQQLKCRKPSITPAEIKSKFMALKTNFLAEHRKHINSKKSGAGSEEIYLPTIWYYQQMGFILEHTTIKVANYDSISDKIDMPDSEISNDISEPDAPHIMNPDDIIIEVCEDTMQESEELQSPTPSKCSSSGTNKRRKRDSDNVETHFFERATIALNSMASQSKPKNIEEDPHTKEIKSFTEFIQAKLLKIKNEDIISEIEAEILNLVNEGYRKYTNL